MINEEALYECLCRMQAQVDSLEFLVEELMLEHPLRHAMIGKLESAAEGNRLLAALQLSNVQSEFVKIASEWVEGMRRRELAQADEAIRH